jgi:F-type H+-transporting ATPase subunit b
MSRLKAKVLTMRLCRLLLYRIPSVFAAITLGACLIATAQDENPPNAHGSSQSVSVAPGERSDESASSEGHAAGDHDPHDLSHQNAGEMLESPAEFKSDLAIWTFILFLCLLAVLVKFAWGPIVAGLEKREQAIAAKIEEAQRSAEQAAKQLQQYEARLAAATEEAKDIIAQARREGEVAASRVVAEAQEVASRERQRAIEDITAAKQLAVQEISERSVDLAVSMAGRLIRREVNAQDRAQLIRDALDQIPSQN